MDAQTRWIEAFPIRAATAEKVVDCLEKEIFLRYAYPETLHSDQGAQFTGRLLKEVGDLLDIVVTHTPAYNPKSNRVERFHRKFKSGSSGNTSREKGRLGRSATSYTFRRAHDSKSPDRVQSLPNHVCPGSSHPVSRYRSAPCRKSHRSTPARLYEETPP